MGIGIRELTLLLFILVGAAIWFFGRYARRSAAQRGSSPRELLRALPEDQVSCLRRAHVLGALIAERGQVDIGEQIFSGAEQDRRHGDVQLVDQPGPQILFDRSDPAAKPHIQPVRRLFGALQCCENTVSDEMESRPALHGERLDRKSVV